MDIIKVYINRMIDPIRVLVETLPTLISMTLRNNIVVISDLVGIAVDMVISIKHSTIIRSNFGGFRDFKNFIFRNRFIVRERIPFSTKEQSKMRNVFSLFMNMIVENIYYFGGMISYFLTDLKFPISLKTNVNMKNSVIIPEDINISGKYTLGSFTNIIKIKTMVLSIFTGKFHILGDFDGDTLGSLDNNTLGVMDYEKV